jgi:alpha-beta hydrolase superfamily lysophospholipase
MNYREGTFRGADGLELHGRCWRPERGAGTALAIVHGHGEHGGRYMNLVDFLLPKGYAVYAFDHRGHGRSRGQRGHIHSWDEYRGDVAAFLRWIAGQEPHAAIFLMGHSMGALVVLDYLIHEPAGIRGAIVSGAPLEPAGVAKHSLVLLSRALSRIAPRFPMRLALDVSALSRDESVVRAYTKDPLVHGRFTARWGTESLDTLARVKGRAADVRVPILFIHGEADRLNLPEGSSSFFEGVASADKTLHLYPKMYHELHNDVGHEAVIADLEEWLGRHLP